MAESEGVHRLRNILVEEVSLVDRPANQRRFLVVKREGDMDELRPDGKGGFTRVRKADDVEDEAEKARKAAEEEEARKKAPPFGGNKAPPFGAGGKPKDGEGDSNEEKAKKLLADNPELATAIKAVFDDQEEKRRKAAKADPADAKLADDLRAVCEELDSLADAIESEGASEPSDVHMKKLVASHKKIGGMVSKYMDKAAKKAIAKVGAKMKASRLAMFKEAMQTLSSLLAELLETPRSAGEHAADPGDPQAPPPGWKPANPSGAPSNAVGKEAIKSLRKGLEELSSEAQRTIERLTAENAALKKGVPAPSSASAGERVSKGLGGGDVSWPRNMNDKTSREQVDKSVSFYDAD